MNKRQFLTPITIIGIFAALAVILTSTISAPASAIKNFFNCMTDKANNHGKLTIDDVNICLHNEYHVYRNLPYDIHNHLFSDGDNNGDNKVHNTHPH
jgi:hypothetical protein